MTKFIFAGNVVFSTFFQRGMNGQLQKITVPQSILPFSTIALLSPKLFIPTPNSEYLALFYLRTDFIVVEIS